MGCLQSKRETLDLHPNVFRVVNIDEQGEDLCSGQLEITESDIVLYREGIESTIWPLHSLRRYGYEGLIFSFESGRRCETGEGIYAFRCRRAELLFKNLQQQIQLRNIVLDVAQYPVSRHSPSPQTRHTLQASTVYRSSVDNGPTNNVGSVHNNNSTNSTMQTIQRVVAQNPRSVSSADIHEVMPLYPRSQTNGSHVTNVYQLRDFKREHNNNQAVRTTDPRHFYSNDVGRDLALLRSTLHYNTAFNTRKEIEEETRFLEARYIDEGNSSKQDGPMSPTLSTSSEHYAQLTMELQLQQEQHRLYMNVAPPGTSVVAPDVNRNVAPPATPSTPKQVEYCNLSVGTRQEINSYANLSLGEVADSVKIGKQKLNLNTADHNQKFSESDTFFTSMSPVEELEVNYAVLDIDAKKEAAKAGRDLTSPESLSYNSSKNESIASCSSHTRSRLVSQTSLEKPRELNLVVAPTINIGYTTIDFDKTVALTSVAAGTDNGKDGPRKTRHNSSNITCGSPTSSDKVKA